MLKLLFILLTPAALYGQVANIGAPLGSNDHTYVVNCGNVSDATAIQAGINASTANGNVVKLVGPCTVGSTITLKGGVVIDLQQGTITWSGANSGTMFNTGSTVVTSNCGIRNGTVYMAGLTTGKVFDFHSIEECRFNDLYVIAGTGTTQTVWNLIADSSTSTGSLDGQTNSLHNSWKNIYNVAGTGIGTCFNVSGTDSTHVFTNSTFENIACLGVDSKAFRFVQWTDSTHWLLARADLEAANAVGFIFNDSGTPGSDVGVYSMKCNTCVVEGVMGLGGRVGIVFNKSHGTVFDNFEYDGRIETQFSDSAHPPDSYQITEDNVSNNIQLFSKGDLRYSNLKFGVTAAILPSQTPADSLQFDVYDNMGNNYLDWLTATSSVAPEVDLYPPNSAAGILTIGKGASGGRFVFTFPPATVSTLGSCGSPQEGRGVLVSDGSNSTTYLSTVTGGGTTRVLAICDSNAGLWKAH